MTTKLVSNRKRPVHLGPFPLERLRRGPMPDLTSLPTFVPLDFANTSPHSIISAMADHQATMDAIRDGAVNGVQAKIPSDPIERAHHFKAFAYFSDAAMVGIGPLVADARLPSPVRNPDIDRLAHDLRTRQTKTLASGIDQIMADLKDAMNTPPRDIDGHHTAIAILNDAPREPWKDEPGADWLSGAALHVAALRAAETAVVIANYIRLLGWDARAHTMTSTDVDPIRLGVAAGVLGMENGKASAPFLEDRVGLAIVTTTLDLQHDKPLKPLYDQPAQSVLTKFGFDPTFNSRTSDPFKKRAFHLGQHPFESLKRVDTPTTYIDEPNVPRVPKRADLFARAQFGDLGKRVQERATGGHYVRKAPTSAAERRMLGAFTLLQDGERAGVREKITPAEAAKAIKATSYFLGIDAVGVSRCPEWTWYSHDATGEPIVPTHGHAISMIVDQGHETMEGASGDDWISVAQSMRAYLRFSLIGGVVARQIRNLGYSAKAHTVIDGEVLQPPLLLLSGLGEVSRIGEVILNPFLGPRLKSGVVTTDLPLDHDKPIDFGLQRFCEGCNKCARECPSGAITAGPKRMFNGYEIWKSDSQKCATYRITTEGGAMCGRCMKTCPWNLEGLFSEAPFRWAATHVPSAAPILAKLDDAMGRGGLNPIKKWWWDIELSDDGGYRPTEAPVNRRDLQPGLDVRPQDQTLAVYPAPLAPHPWPYPAPMDREAGIVAYAEMLSPEDYKAARASGTDAGLHRYDAQGESPVLRVRISKAERLTPDVTKFEFRLPDGGDLPEWTAGSHLDVVVAPEFLRQYSMSGDPADRSVYQIAVLREDEGRGGSSLMHRIFNEGRRVFISRPINHFPLAEDAVLTVLGGGGIGVTPMIAMAHELHRNGADFRLHYSVPSRGQAAFLEDIANVPWADKVTTHVSDENTRADFDALFHGLPKGTHVYTCGPDAYMSAVLDAAERAGVPEDARHLEYFAVPEEPERENHPFRITLARSGRTVEVAAEQSASDALLDAGIAVDVKCSDGLCGVCRCTVLSGEVDHRDHVLSKSERKNAMIACRSRAARPNGEIELDL